MTRSAGRLAATMIAVLAALLVQVTVLPHFAWHIGGLGIVPDVVLLVVVATALATDTRFATLAGFGAGLLLDVAPPADHIAGRWTLALMVVGHVVGRLAHDDRADVGRFDGEVVRRVPASLGAAAAAGGSFVGVSVFAISGVLLGDISASTGDLLKVVTVGLVLDLVAAAVVLPLALRLFRRFARGSDRLAGPARPLRPARPARPARDGI